MLDLARDQWSVIPLGIDAAGLDAELDFAKQLTKVLPDRSARVGYLARLDPAKGLHHLVDAFIELSSREDSPVPNVELHVAGWLGGHNAEYAEEQWRRLDAAGLSGRYEYHGSPDHDEKQEFLRKLDLFCVPTEYEEPKGLYVLEAMAAGVPVIAPRHGAFPEIISADVTGLLVSPCDPVAIADALEKLLSDSALRSSLRQAGRHEVASNRTIDVMAGKLVQLIESHR